MTSAADSAPPLDAESLAALRSAVRSFLREEVMSGGFTPQVDGWGRGFSRAFSMRLAAHGWVGMTIPTRYGGGGRSHLERFVVAEELVAAGAPVLAHWSAERQIAPMLLRIGTDAQKTSLLPGIARGELSFGLGLSEPGAGSDLAAVTTRADRTEGGWRVTGQKVWTSAAHHCEYMFVLCRTDPAAERHEGLSQLLVDMTSDGIAVRPILTMAGDAEFCEVFFDNVFVPDDAVIGTVGNGWLQVTQELGWERSGPDRYLSSYPLLERFFAVAGQNADADAGRLVARTAALRALSFRIAVKGQAGIDFGVDAALAKDAGNRFEQDSIEVVHRTVGSDCADDRLRELIRSARLVAPTFSLRGGTNEIMRSVVTKQLMQGAAPADRTDLGDMLERMFTQCVPSSMVAGVTDDAGRADRDALWATLEQLGITQLVVPEGLGGSGGDNHDAAIALIAAGRHAVPLPLAETMFLAGPALAACGIQVPKGRLAVAGLDETHRLRLTVGSARAAAAITGSAPRVLWGGHVDAVVFVAAAEHGDLWAGIVPDIQVRGRGDTIAGEPADDLEFESMEIAACAPAPADLLVQLRRRRALMRCLQTVGALERIQSLTLRHAADRIQFGRPIARFQAVAQHIASLAADVALARAAVDLALNAVSDVGGVPLIEVASARVVCAAAAQTVSAAAHQVHGAIGVTAEHPLHLFTRRSWAWQDDGDPEPFWAAELGKAARTAPDGGWALISATELRIT